MKNQNTTLKEMLKKLRSKGLGVYAVEKSLTREGVYKIRFANGFLGYFNENDHINSCIRGSLSNKLDKRNRAAKEIIEKGEEYIPGILVRF